MSDIFTCPTGPMGRIREMKVREDRLLANRKLGKAGGYRSMSFRPGDGRRA